MTASAPIRPVSVEQVFEEHLAYVNHSLRRLGVAESAIEDVAQEVFLRVHEKLAQYDAQRPMRPWLFGIAFREASAWRNRASTRREELHEEVDVGLTEWTPESDAESSQLRRLVVKALQRLDDNKRAVFILHELDGHPVPEVAKVLDLPVNTAWSRLRAARREFASAWTEVATPPRGTP